MRQITAIYLALLVNPNRRTSTIHGAKEDPPTRLTRHIFRRPKVNFHLNLQGHTNACNQYLNSNSRLRDRYAGRYGKINSLFRNHARRGSNFDNATFGNFIHRNGTDSLQINNRVLVNAIRSGKVILGVGARLLTRNHGLTNFTTGRKRGLLNHRQLRPTPTFLRFTRRRVRLHVQLLRIKRIRLTDTNLNRLVSSLTPLSTTFVLAGSSTKTIQVFNHLFNMKSRNFNRLFVNILRVSSFRCNNIKGR